MRHLHEEWLGMSGNISVVKVTSQMKDGSICIFYSLTEYYWRWSWSGRFADNYSMAHGLTRDCPELTLLASDCSQELIDEIAI